jgi:hypothetical protein
MKKCLMARGVGEHRAACEASSGAEGMAHEHGGRGGFYFEFLMISRGVRPNMRFIQCAMWL